MLIAKRVVALVMLVALVGVAGCQETRAHMRAEKAGKKTGQGLRDIRVELEGAQRQIDATVVALTDLVKNPAGDIEAKVARLDQEIAKLELTGQDIQARREDVRANRAKLFKAWDEELALMSSEKKVNRTAEQQAGMYAGFERIADQVGTVRASYDPFLAKLNDIRAQLSKSGATKEVIASLADEYESTINEAEQVKLAINGLNSELFSMSDQLGSTR
jgi:DNA repair exonuclease SbcCD ATPase subunit